MVNTVVLVGRLTANPELRRTDNEIPVTKITLAVERIGYSKYWNRVHYTPIWYNDGKYYTPVVHVYDCWTPAGMLSSQSSDSIMIQGNLFQDVHWGPTDPNSDY